ncbi:MAG: hypothetical protein JRN62_01875 [Nitrososphaerota archaeon]|nr:hypothetical protein [Nitrososphaerota archaeon]
MIAGIQLLPPSGTVSMSGTGAMSVTRRIGREVAINPHEGHPQNAIILLSERTGSIRGGRFHHPSASLNPNT